MGPRTLRVVLYLSLLSAPLAGAQVFVVGVKTAEADAITEFHATHVQLPGGELDQRGRLDLIRNLEAEQGFAHRELPLGAGLTLVANGNMTPRDDAYEQMLYEKGQSAGPGDRVEVSALKFEADRIVIDFNGGPYAKHRFLSHISVNDMQLAPQGPIATGCRVTLVFEGGVPEISAAEVKALLDPVIDFKAKSSAEAYADSLTPKVKLAVETHHVLVGMDRRMVTAALGEPKSKHREHTKPGDADSPFWEEWIYGPETAATQGSDLADATQFVRFEKGRVSRLEIAALGKPLEIHDHSEIDMAAAPILESRTLYNGDAQADPNNEHAHQAPTLSKPGEVLDAPRTMGKVNLPGTTPSPAKNLARNENPGT